jgi:methionyl-tRNA formyltransferase
MNILLVGEESAGIQTLKALAQSQHHLVAVMASPTRRSTIGATMWQVAQRLGYPTWPAQRVKDPALAQEIRQARVDILLNVHSLFVIHPQVIEVPRFGSYNLHPGPLPQYAGLNTVSWAIYHGATHYGVTVHKMTAEIDAGPIIYQASFAIAEHDTALRLYSKCIQHGMGLLHQLLAALSCGAEALPLVPQDLHKRQYFGKHIPHGGRVVWSQPARAVVNFVRACDYFPFPSPWGYPHTQSRHGEYGVIKVQRTGQTCNVPPGTVAISTGSGVTIACCDEWLRCDKLLIAGRPVSAAEVLQPGDHLGDGA